MTPALAGSIGVPVKVRITNVIPPETPEDPIAVTAVIVRSDSRAVSARTFTFAAAAFERQNPRDRRRLVQDTIQTWAQGIRRGHRIADDLATLVDTETEIL